MSSTFIMRRRDVNVGKHAWSNPGLLLDRGFIEWCIAGDRRGEDIQGHIHDVCEVTVPEIYQHALVRWLGLTGDMNRFATTVGILKNRLYIGLGMPHVLETQVTRQNTYGMPYIPGSALKGLARAWAEKAVAQKMIEQAVVDVLFGQGGESPDKADTGYLVFHDAWWLPSLNGQHQKKPYVPEIITVHAEKYYQNKGKNCPHPDLESPNPNNQIAVQGSFYFVVEGKHNWARLGLAYLKQGLQEEGIGGKVASGYGYFNFANTRQQQEIATLATKIHKQDQARREKRLEEFRKIRAQEREKQLVARMDRFAVAIYALEKALASGTGPMGQAKEHINKLVNKIIKDKETWPKEHRLAALPVIEKAYKLTVKRRNRNRKIKKVQKWADSAT